ncbi:predicted protein [Plenodomus lingam JN3]|uniref:Predicted protein n=1 Tax=Leptosphaeria maculans (strain JN3 / isolate v23.1.3 / race Av1-4-5-6-7-8) TaxID=985895 RepID=E5A225_LEPMJ|nr:predicted protein [Plenodomus lingam JN3]CBX97742.1 predicted protein [Plenodomus lingam JN3]
MLPHVVLVLPWTCQRVVWSSIRTGRPVWQTEIASRESKPMNRISLVVKIFAIRDKEKILKHQRPPVERITVA